MNSRNRNDTLGSFDKRQIDQIRKAQVEVLALAPQFSSVESVINLEYQGSGFGGLAEWIEEIEIRIITTR